MLRQFTLAVLVALSLFLPATAAEDPNAQKFSCGQYITNDDGRIEPSAMWRDVEWGLYGQAGPGLTAWASSRAGACTPPLALGRQGNALNQRSSVVPCDYGVCPPPPVWLPGPVFFCESVGPYYSGIAYSYQAITVKATSRCDETLIQLSGPTHIPSNFDNVIKPAVFKVQLSEQASYFHPSSFHISLGVKYQGRDFIEPTSYTFLTGSPMNSSGFRQPDGSGLHQATFDPKAFFRQTTVTPQTLTFIATCSQCQKTATWDVRIGAPDIVIGFFNGVANTEKASLDSLDRLKEEFGSQYQDAPLEYDWFYNQTACQEGIIGKIPCLDDVAEVFEARTGELNGIFANRWEVFWDILAGRHRHSDSWSGRLIGLLGDGGNALLQWMDATANAAFNRLATMFFDMLSLFTSSPTYANQAEHLHKLQQYADEGTRFVMVAHSQGNLFVNTAFDGLKAARPEARAQVVHVAPASPTLRGDHVLADIDIVINGLRVTGLNSVPPANINLPVNLSADFSGHGFEPTYLDKARAAYARTIGMITTSLEALAP